MYAAVGVRRKLYKDWDARWIERGALARVLVPQVGGRILAERRLRSTKITRAIIFECHTGRNVNSREYAATTRIMENKRWVLLRRTGTYRQL